MVDRFLFRRIMRVLALTAATSLVVPLERLISTSILVCLINILHPILLDLAARRKLGLRHGQAKSLLSRVFTVIPVRPLLVGI